MIRDQTLIQKKEQETWAAIVAFDVVENDVLKAFVAQLLLQNFIFFTGMCGGRC